MFKLRDGLVNLVSGLGTSRDKGGQGAYSGTLLERQKLLDAYHGSSMVRRVIDLPAEDAVREWRTWQAPSKQINKIEAEEKRLALQTKVLEARRLARLLGFSAILIGDGAVDPMEPLNPEALGVGGLKYITVLEPGDLAMGPVELDPLSPYFRQPAYWQFTSGKGRATQIHPSRLALFTGVSPLATLAGNQIVSSWGTSVLNGMLEAIMRVDEGAGNVLSLVYEAKVDVIKLKGFMDELRMRGDDYTTEVLQRLGLAATAKGINGMLLLDSEEEYDQKHAQFGGLPDIMDRFMQLASASCGIPVTLLFGISPGGLNATGESDVRAYYDRVRTQQTMYMTPAMHVLDESLIRSSLGTRPADLHYNWNPLWQESSAQVADNADKLMSAATKLFAFGGVSTEAITKAAVNSLTETGAFPGLEDTVDEFEQTEPTEGEEGAIERVQQDPEEGDDA